MVTTTASAILQLLSRGPGSSEELAQALGVSQSTLSRALRPLQDAGQIVRVLGTTRGARYGLARDIGAVGSSWPLFQIDQTGAALELASMQAIAPEQYYLRGGPPRITGLFEGLPYFLQDARPAGFLGRAIPAAHPELKLPARVQDWTEAHVITYLTQRGSGSVGNLIVGAEALDRHLSGAHEPELVSADARPAEFPMLARAAMLGAPPGSSAQGEQPKFSARLALGQTITHVLVKFSPARNTATGQRWADLLIAEHLASVVLNEHGIAAARSEILEFDEQVFLQSERFDRVGADGRRGVASLYSVDLQHFGRLDSWTLAAQRLCAAGLLARPDAERITLLDAFGSLIANTDRHFGNITLFDRHDGPFELAPVYDMLPMLFAPRDGQLVERAFEPAGPAAATLAVWPQAREIAERYWARLCEQPRLSDDFRRRCGQCLETLRGLPQRGASRTNQTSSEARRQT